MTVTSTTIAATNCGIWLDNAAGTLTDISGSTNSVTITPEHGVADWRVFGSAWHQRKVIGKSVTMAIKAVYTTDAAEVTKLLENWWSGGNDAARTMTVYVPDKNVGSGVYSGEFVLSSPPVVTLDAEADDVVRVDAELQSHGAVTFGTAAT